MSFLKKVEAATTIKNAKAALECVDYILDTEAEDYFEQAAEHGITPKNWDKLSHVFASACKAIGIKPEPTDFKDQD